MAPVSETGKRLLVHLIDQYATDEPGRIWASIPADNNDISKGFRDITYKEFADAINRAAHWLRTNLKSNSKAFDTIAYAGPKDLRYPIIAVAALKCQKKILMCSPFASVTAQVHLLKITECSSYLCAAPLAHQVRTIVGSDSTIFCSTVPELDNWLLTHEPVIPISYDKTWDEAAADPWIIFHTSGTTGLPKPIVYTNRMMTSIDAAELMPDSQDGPTMNTLFRGQRYFVSLPTLHFVGMTAALQLTTFLNIVLVTGPSSQMTPAQMIEVLTHSKAQGVIMPPSQLEDVIREPNGLEILRSLNCIYFAGAPMPRQIAEKLVGHCTLFPGMGSTEAGAYQLKVRNESDDWDYYCMRPAMGVEFVPKTEELCELVFRRQPQLKRWQQVFEIYPDLEEFPTKDLWVRHPSRPELWRYAGRTDDLVILSHGEDLYANDLEAVIQQCPLVRTAIIGGDRKPKPFVIVDLLDTAKQSLDDDQRRHHLLNEIWPYVEEANKLCSSYVAMTKELVIFTDRERPPLMSAKQTVLRRSTIALYQSEIDELYS